MKYKKGTAAWIIVLIVVGLIAVIGLAYWGIASYLAVVTPVVVIDYDGEFDDGFLATKGDFYSDFTEGTDCNVTSDVLGGASYTTCIYDTSTNINPGSNSTEYRFDWAFDLDDDVELIEFEGDLQNTGTGQAKDDLVIKEVELWTHDSSDEAVLVMSSEDFNIDNEDGDFEGEYGPLEGDEYVLHIVLRTKLVAPQFADGDDIMKIQLDLTTDGDTDAARVLLEE